MRIRFASVYPQVGPKVQDFPLILLEDLEAVSKEVEEGA